MPMKEKIKAVAQKMYGADDVEFSATAQRILKQVDDLGLSNLPVCIAKTQNSLSDDPKLIGRPKGFTVTINSIDFAAGAGFIVPIAGSIMRMPFAWHPSSRKHRCGQ